MKEPDARLKHVAKKMLERFNKLDYLLKQAEVEQCAIRRLERIARKSGMIDGSLLMTVIFVAVVAAITIMSCFHIVFTNRRLAKVNEDNVKMAAEVDKSRYKFLGGVNGESNEQRPN